jgi:hypothetical protein
MEDVNISKFRAQVVRAGSTPASPGFVVSEGQNPVDPSGSGQTHLPVTIATVSTGLSITESQILSGAGLVSQYIRGDGSLADFPATTGGGSSVSYYLNGSVSQGTIGGVAYKELNKTPIFGAGTDISISADGYIASFITDALDPNKLLIPAGNWNLETYFSASSNGGSPTFYVELYKYNGTTFTLIASSSSAPELIAFGTNLNPYYSTLAVPETVLALTDRLALRYYVTHSGRTITLHTENNHLCQVITTFTTGLTALNGLTSQVQYLTVGTSGTDFAISSASDTHTFNLPTASATNRGALSSGDWTTFNNKTSNLGTVTSVGLSSATSGVTIGSTPITTSGTITLAIATASGSQNGLLSSTDWTTFNGKQNALTNPVTGTGTTNYLPKFTGASTIGNSLVFDNGTNIGIGTNVPVSFGSGYTSTDIRGTNGGGILFGITSGVNGQLYADATSTVLFSTGARPFQLYVNSGLALTLASTGVATFSSSVGVNGVTSPAAELQVGKASDVTIAMSNSSSVTSGNRGSIAWYNSNVSTVANIRAVAVTDNVGTELQFYTRPAAGSLTQVMTINSGGNVGINTTSPNAKLEVNGNIYTTNNTNFVLFGTNASLNPYIQGGSDNSIAIGTGNLSRLFITSGGNVGIGTTSPSAYLDIVAPAGVSGPTLLRTYSNQHGLGFKSVISGTYTTIETNNTSYPLVFNPSGGNVLIGTTSDAGFKLNVNGTARFSDNVNLAYNKAILGRNIGNTLDITLIGVFAGLDKVYIDPSAYGTILGGAVTINSLGTGSVTATAGLLSTVSDSSYKIDDSFIDSAIEKVLNLKPRYFYWNEKSGLPTNKRQLGFYAQEVNEALGEEAANTPQDKNTPWGISDRSMIAMLTKAIQELKEEIDTLKN